MSEENLQIPKEVSEILGKLNDAGFEAYIVGGSVRDLLLARRPVRQNFSVGGSLDEGGSGEKPKDWDITTSAKPEEIQKNFLDSFYENKFLTVTVKTGSDEPSLKEVEITTFRAEGKYTDKRHPDEIRFAETLEEDLSRRDFTINAIALKTAEEIAVEIIDPFGGQKDLENKLIRAVGDPEKRFEEDALRMMRAIRLAVELDFIIEPDTLMAIQKEAGLLNFIAKERIRDELIKIFMTKRARYGIELLHEAGLLKFIIPELEEGIGVTNRPKIFTIWEHNLKALDYAPKADFPLDVRIAALLHDVGKPRTKGPMKNNEWTFYGHDVVGSRMSIIILERLHFPKDMTEKIAKLIRWHLFRYESEEATTDSSVRRLIRRVGYENMSDLVKLRICDRMGMDVPKAVPYRLRHFQFRVEKILKEEEAPTPKILKVNGEDIMKILEISPGPKIGRIIEVLMQDVLDDPVKNNNEELESRIKNLGKLSDEELVKMAEEAENKVELVKDERISKLKAKYWVR